MDDVVAIIGLLFLLGPAFPPGRQLSGRIGHADRRLGSGKITGSERGQVRFLLFVNVSSIL